MCRVETTVYPQVAILKTKKSYYNCYQDQGESNSNYVDRFNSTIDVITKHEGGLDYDEYLVEDPSIMLGSDVEMVSVTGIDEYEEVIKINGIF